MEDAFALLNTLLIAFGSPYHRVPNGNADEELTAFLELERAICIHLLTEQI